MILPKELAKTLPKSRLLTESEWRGIGVQQSRGWQHYAIHRYVLTLFSFFKIFFPFTFYGKLHEELRSIDDTYPFQFLNQTSHLDGMIID